MPEQAEIPQPGQVLTAAARRAVRRPFAILLLLSLFVALVSGTVTDPDAAFVTALVLLVVETYIDIAVVLAAAAPDPGTSADPWIRAAFRRRVFWRFVVANIITFFLVGFGFVFLLVPGLIVAGLFGLAPVTTVLERRTPGDALRRSRELSGPERKTVAVAFGLLQALPTLAVQVWVSLDPDAIRTFLVPLNLVSVVLARIGTIALVDVFMRAGGEVVTSDKR